jgi:hypothetical protein
MGPVQAVEKMTTIVDEISTVPLARAGPEMSTNVDVEKWDRPDPISHTRNSVEPSQHRAPVKPRKSTPKRSTVTGNGKVKKPKGKSTTKPPKPSGYFFRKDGAGWELRKDVYVTGNDGVKKRKQPYVAHLSREAFSELKKRHKGKSLDAAIQQWIAEHDR